jgi:hypothetical protein
VRLELRLERARPLPHLEQRAQLPHQPDAVGDGAGVRDVDRDAPGPERLDVLAHVLLHVGDDEVGAEVADELEPGILLAADPGLGDHPLGWLGAVDCAAHHAIPRADGEQDLGDAGDQGDDAPGRHRRG